MSWFRPIARLAVLPALAAGCGLLGSQPISAPAGSAAWSPAAPALPPAAAARPKKAAAPAAQTDPVLRAEALRRAVRSALQAGDREAYLRWVFELQELKNTLDLAQHLRLDILTRALGPPLPREKLGLKELRFPAEG